MTRLTWIARPLSITSISSQQSRLITHIGYIGMMSYIGFIDLFLNMVLCMNIWEILRVLQYFKRVFFLNIPKTVVQVRNVTHMCLLLYRTFSPLYTTNTIFLKGLCFYSLFLLYYILLFPKVLSIFEVIWIGFGVLTIGRSPALPEHLGPFTEILGKARGVPDVH